MCIIIIVLDLHLPPLSIVFTGGRKSTTHRRNPYAIASICVCQVYFRRGLSQVRLNNHYQFTIFAYTSTRHERDIEKYSNYASACAL